MVAGAINPTSPVQINRIADQDLTGIREDPGESDIPLPLQRKINEHKPRTRASRRVYKAEGMATRGVAPDLQSSCIRNLRQPAARSWAAHLI